MGRWGYRLFEGDTDQDLAGDIDCFARDGKGNELHLMRLVNEPDTAIITATRQKLNAGLCDKLFDKFRALEHEYDGKYRVCILGALMMRTGAQIRQADLDHLRELAEGFAGRHGYVSPLAEDGFRHVGKVQFLAALDHYEAGTPRDFDEPSCFHCGKIKADIGQAPKKCGKCGGAWYCNVECQRAAWRTHKPVCKTFAQSGMFLNV
ncbi:hypothetical protein K4K54_009579 [Colletotrichum sp. SAR 10_86]|nr:hypothetical protein KHU50_002907 [Colletotrichum sp. SAR 10_65]KAI8219317.1 hypothetical protein K4K54_009579 [Colletotrichum sp. SAR 10_86]KAJ4999275.1 hypothetical protein K4K48_004330 [Colletotrichum sp. SAR 10_66]